MDLGLADAKEAEAGVIEVTRGADLTRTDVCVWSARLVARAGDRARTGIMYCEAEAVAWERALSNAGCSARAFDEAEEGDGRGSMLGDACSLLSVRFEVAAETRTFSELDALQVQCIAG